ncbi:MAG: hypothetical protein K1X88_09865 [Nannocystaceae bacterium]|nr:hypothetical protein [Nannocystaceae bacterium]
MPSPGEYDSSGPSLRLVVSIVVVLALVLGVVAYWRYTVSERFFADSLPEIDRVAPTLDTEGCVDEVLGWHRRCEANKPLCDEGVVRVMTHCLMGRDRSDTCSGLDLSSSKATWVFERCTKRGTPCTNRKSCPCADAYRTVDSFCRHEQKGVAL